MPFDAERMLCRLMDLPGRASRRLLGQPQIDYRAVLFDELRTRLAGREPSRVLEIGPRDGEDTKRLTSLNQKHTVLVDLPNREEWIRSWLPVLAPASVELLVGNLMYDTRIEALEPFDVVWCTGVLYHNPEQLRMMRRLFDLTKPGGVLVMESATARRPGLRHENVVEIWYPADKAKMRPLHISTNVTHLPSRRAMQSWMEMVGFEDIRLSACHRAVGRGLAADRAAFIGLRPTTTAKSATYYSSVGLNYEMGLSR